MITIITSILYLLSMNISDVFTKKEIDNIKRSSNFELCKLNGLKQIEAQNRDSSKTYIDGYEVLSRQLVDKKNRRLVKRELLRPATYITENSRSCDFTPSFAIIIDKNDFFLISTGDCPKASFSINNNSENQRNIIDLSKGSGLEKLLLSQKATDGYYRPGP